MGYKSLIEKLSANKSLKYNAQVLPIAYLALDPTGTRIVVVRDKFPPCYETKHKTFFEIYENNSNGIPKMIGTFIVHEQVSGIGWMNNKKLLITTFQQTIALFDIISTNLAISMISDYGPISCMKLLANENLFVTGTKFGYVVAYTIDMKKFTIEMLRKMVKSSGSITKLDYFIEGGLESLQTKTKPGKRKRNQPSDKTEADTARNYDRMTVYGSTKGQLTVWEFGKGTILDTIQACEEPVEVSDLSIMRNGDIVVVDTSGSLSVFDPNTLTCRQNLKLFDGKIVCLAKDSGTEHMFVSGSNQFIMQLKRDVCGKNFVIFDKNKIQNKPLNCILTYNKKVFFAGGEEGTLVKCELTMRNGRKEFLKTPVLASVVN